MYLQRADHSSRGVLPTVVRCCVWYRNIKNEEAMTRVGSQRHRKKNVYMLSLMSTLEKAYCVRFNFRFDFTGHSYRAWWWEMSTVSSQKSVSCFWRDTVVQWDLTLRWLMSYIYGAPILDVSRSHTTTQHSR